MMAWRTRFACLTLLALVGCDGGIADGNGTMVTPEETPTPAAILPAPTDNLSTATEYVEKLPPVDRTAPQPATAPPAKMHPRKDFTDPPLPAELNQDGGLKPLPPRP